MSVVGRSERAQRGRERGRDGGGSIDRGRVLLHCKTQSLRPSNGSRALLLRLLQDPPLQDDAIRYIQGPDKLGSAPGALSSKAQQLSMREKRLHQKLCPASHRGRRAGCRRARPEQRRQEPREGGHQRERRRCCASGWCARHQRASCSASAACWLCVFLGGVSQKLEIPVGLCCGTGRKGLAVTLYCDQGGGFYRRGNTATTPQRQSDAMGERSLGRDDMPARFPAPFALASSRIQWAHV